MNAQSKDQLGDRMKAYELVETEARFDRTKPLYARIDGRAFSTFTRGMNKPFDLEMTVWMSETTKYLVRATHALIGFVQSDEISLVWENKSDESEFMFGGKKQKLASVLASMTASRMMDACRNSGYSAKLPHFDCRVLSIPSREETANMLLWRAQDAKKNSISMVAQAHFSPKQLHGKGEDQRLKMLEDIGVHWDQYMPSVKHGTWVRSVTEPRMLTEYELAQIPEKHRPTGPVDRSEVKVIRMPYFGSVINRVGVVFEKEEPRT